MADDISQRTKVLIGEDGVEALRDSYVVLAGVGAVGGMTPVLNVPVLPVHGSAV